MTSEELLSRIDESRVAQAIAAAERRSAAEVRVCVSRRRWDDVLEAARQRFQGLAMDRTAARNGVLIFFAPESRRFAIWGDVGVHARCGAGCWEEIVASMTPHLQSGSYTEAVVLAVERVGDLLARHFPRRPDDANELPDTVVGD